MSGRRPPRARAAASRRTGTPNKEIETRLYEALAGMAILLLLVLAWEHAPGSGLLTQRQAEGPANLAGRAYSAIGLPAVAALPAFNPYLQNLRDGSVTIGIIGPITADFRVQWSTTPGVFSTANEVVAQQGQAAGCSGCAHYFATLPGLAPGTAYYYQVLDGAAPVTPMGGLTADDYTFTTDGPGLTSFRFAVGGDIGEPGGLQGDTVAFLKALNPRPRLLLIPGDVAYDWGSLADYTRNFWPYLDDISPFVAIYPVPGNHDHSNIDDFGKTWALPPWQGGDTLGVYAFSYGSFLFLNVDSGGGGNGVHSSSIETAMRSILAANQDKDWSAAQFHHPAKSCTYYGDGATEGYFGTFDGAGGARRVDFLFEGHSHSFERTKPLTSAGVALNSNGPYVDPPGTISIVAGSPAKIAAGSSTCGLTARQEDTVGVLVVDVNCDTVTLTMYDTSGPGAGTIIDQTTVRKIGIECGCGNGVVDAGEACDRNGNAGCAAGASCAPDCSACIQNPVCGNGNIETGEACDGANLGGQTCAGRGHVGGTLSCAPDCAQFDESACHDCGDGVKEDYEACDGGDFGGQTCQTFGFDEGTLACTGACAVDTSGCRTCVPTAPPDEVCDGQDNDCNGQTDEGGACCAAVPEVCDGADNDCDALIDEGDVCCPGGSSPSPEVCDGQDNDCDRQTDEGGVCCLGSEPCDGFDNDCDGQTDEGCCTATGGSDLVLSPLWSAAVTAAPTSAGMRDVAVFSTASGPRVVAGDKANSRLLFFNAATRSFEQALPAGLAVTSVFPAHGNLYVVGSGSLKTVSPGLAITPLAPTFSTPEGVAADNSRIFVGENTGNSVSAVPLASPGAKIGFATISTPTDLLVSGDALHAGTETGKAVNVYALGSAAPLRSYGAGKIANKPTGLAADASGSVYVADGGSGGSDKIYKYDGAGNYQGRFGIGASWDPRGVWADEASGEFYAVDDGGDKLYAFDLAPIKSITGLACPPLGTIECTPPQLEGRACGAASCAGTESRYCVGGYWSGWTACSAPAPAPEICGNDLDEDCDGADLPCCQTDADLDGFRAEANCVPRDCNDANAAIYPGAAERCDRLDNDCDGAVDEGLRCRTSGSSPLFSKANLVS